MRAESAKNFIWRLEAYALRQLVKAPLLGPFVANISNRQFARHFVADLQRLNDVLNNSELADRYWLWAGILLGWAREGQPLAHDRDVDFAILPTDVPRLMSAVPSLKAAGFHPLMKFHNSDGDLTELTFRCHRAKFEFFVFAPVDEQLKYYVYGGGSSQPMEIESRIRRQQLVTFDFLGRQWLRHEDFDEELTAMYGDWRTPNTNWNYLTDDLAVVSRRRWTNTSTNWE